MNEIIKRLEKLRWTQYRLAALESFPKDQQTPDVIKNIEKAATIFAKTTKDEVEFYRAIIDFDRAVSTAKIPTKFTTIQGPLIPIS